MEASLEQIIRFVGDGIAKSRATPTMERQPEQRPQGMIAITGEDSSGSHSSLLRCLFVQVMKDSYDKELLSSLQRHPNLWTE